MAENYTANVVVESTPGSTEKNSGVKDAEKADPTKSNQEAVPATVPHGEEPVEHQATVPEKGVEDVPVEESAAVGSHRLLQEAHKLAAEAEAKLVEEFNKVSGNRSLLHEHSAYYKVDVPEGHGPRLEQVVDVRRS